MTVAALVVATVSGFAFGFWLGRRRGAALVHAAAMSHQRIQTAEDMDVQREALRNYDFEGR